MPAASKTRRLRVSPRRAGALALGAVVLMELLRVGAQLGALAFASMIAMGVACFLIGQSRGAPSHDDNDLKAQVARLQAELDAEREITSGYVQGGLDRLLDA